MAEHLDDIATYVSGKDTSELAKVKAELEYALSCLDREMAIRAEADAALISIDRIVHTPTKSTKFKSAGDHFQADFDAIRKLTAPYRSLVGDAGKP